MDRIETNDPFLILKDIETRSRQHAKSLPRLEDVGQIWKGIGFLFDGHYCVAPLEQVSEILPVPSVTKVPHVKFWLEGIANVRGTLLPIVELASYMGLKMVKRSKDARIIVINHAGISSGVIVEDVLGLQHFNLENKQALTSDMLPHAQRYLEGVFLHNGERWHIFSLFKLLTDESFMQVAV